MRRLFPTLSLSSSLFLPDLTDTSHLLRPPTKSCSSFRPRLIPVVFSFHSFCPSSHFSLPFFGPLLFLIRHFAPFLTLPPALFMERPCEPLFFLSPSFSRPGEFSHSLKTTKHLESLSFSDTCFPFSLCHTHTFQYTLLRTSLSFVALLAQSEEHQPSKLRVAGSSPA